MLTQTGKITPRGAIKSIQRGQVQVPSNSNYGSVTIAAVDLSKCELTNLGGISSMTGVWLSNSTTIQVYGDYSNQMAIGWQVVEYF
jgi:hypothetical protein